MVKLQLHFSCRTLHVQYCTANWPTALHPSITNAMIAATAADIFATTVMLLFGLLSLSFCYLRDLLFHSQVQNIHSPNLLKQETTY